MPIPTYLVFFDFDKSNLTDATKAVISEAVKAAKMNRFVTVNVTGHTDTVGSDSDDQRLSVSRAQAVKDEMVRDGVASRRIRIEGKSFHDLLVPTGLGVREAQNNRAVINLAQSAARRRPRAHGAAL